MTPQEKTKCLEYLPEGQNEEMWLAAFELVLPGVSIPYNGIGRVKKVLQLCAEWGVSPDNKNLSVQDGTNFRKPPAGERVGKIGANTESRWVSRTYWLVLA